MMTNLKISSIGVGVLLLTHFGLIAYFYPILPESVPMHFGSNGKATSFSSKESMILSHLAVIAVLLVIFGIVGALLRSGKAVYFNLPNREYWFAPERKAQSSNEVLALLLWILCSVLVLMLLVFYETAESAMLGTNKLGAAFYIGFAFFILFDMFVLIYLMMRFSTIPK
ncbi:MAG: DUF1648 domain-containing protein [Chloroherpetonaceae bacterium]